MSSVVVFPVVVVVIFVFDVFEFKSNEKPATNGDVLVDDVVDDDEDPSSKVEDIFDISRPPTVVVPVASKYPQVSVANESHPPPSPNSAGD